MAGAHHASRTNSYPARARRKLLVDHELWHDSVTVGNGTFPDPDDEALAKTEGEWLARVRNLLQRAGRDV